VNYAEVMGLRASSLGADERAWKAACLLSPGSLKLWGAANARHQLSSKKRDIKRSLALTF
jgi:hypothetical protein